MSVSDLSLSASENAKPALPGLTGARCAMPAAGIALALTGAVQAVAEMAEDKMELPKLTVEEKKETAAVSSPKFTEPLRDTPQTVIVIPREIFAQQGATTL